MILGDSLSVMASLAEREGLRGKVQCIYIDPPYGIRFNSNFQWSTTSRDVKDGNKEHITREPEQVKAFRDTWRDGIHSYLTYLRHRLTVARDLLADSGSIFVQIGDENVHPRADSYGRGVWRRKFCGANLFSQNDWQRERVSRPVRRLHSLVWKKLGGHQGQASVSLSLRPDHRTAIQYGCDRQLCLSTALRSRTQKSIKYSKEPS